MERQLHFNTGLAEADKEIFNLANSKKNTENTSADIECERLIPIAEKKATNKRKSKTFNHSLKAKKQRKSSRISTEKTKTYEATENTAPEENHSK